MADSYRIRTELGVNKSINVQLDQDFEFLEILSLKIQQSEIYDRSCANYGVVVGRVTANNGLGIPNAKVSIFIPINDIDESNPIIQSIYPYKSPSDSNEDGYRYNLLPYEKSYAKHAATGTFPSLDDVLTDTNAIEIYDRYFRFTTKTNESGDFMIFGAPIGNQTVVMDVDLSDIGEFSLTPQDLIRMGIATPSQVGVGTFNTSNDLSSLPQIINIQKNINVNPLWGDPNVCQISITRVDFDLRDEANIDIQPTSVFMGSIFSSSDKQRVKTRGRIKSSLGNTCDLITGPGQILAIRQTMDQDEDGNPVLEVYKIEQGGNVIDQDGTWVIELPMNLEYIVTNEFGEKVISNDPTIGVPTKAKYRFKVRWQQPKQASLQTRRANYLVPNVREYGWSSPNNDPNTRNNKIPLLKSSYYFGLAWSGYTQGFTGQKKIQRLNDVINCEDTFYEFQYNRVYTVSSLIDHYQTGGKAQYIGIKQVNKDDCRGSIVRFPVNDGESDYNFAYFLYSYLLTLVGIIFLQFLPILHIVMLIFRIVIWTTCLICGISILGVRPFSFICRRLKINCTSNYYAIRLPMMSYPECNMCKCKPSVIESESPNENVQGVLSYLSLPQSYLSALEPAVVDRNIVESQDGAVCAQLFSEAIGGSNDVEPSLFKFKRPKSGRLKFAASDDYHIAYSDTLPIGERVNLFNSRKSYFDGLNKIGVTFSFPQNPGQIHYDNTITVLANNFYESGTLLTSVNPATSQDLNYLYTASTASAVTFGITGTTNSGPININVNYAINQKTNQTVTYSLPNGSNITRYAFPMDREYFQVVTAITVSDASKIWFTGNTQTFPNLLNTPSKVYLARKDFDLSEYVEREETYDFNPLQLFEDYENQYILILQRGVDPYSPLYTNVYQIGSIFGKSIPDITVTASTRLNIPIQKVNGPKSIQSMTQSEMGFSSYFFTAGSEFTAVSTTTLGYYSSLDFDTQTLAEFNYSGVKGLRSLTANAFYSQLPNSSKYDLGEDVTGASYMFTLDGQPWFTRDEFFGAEVSWDPDVLIYDYRSKTYTELLSLNPVKLNNKGLNVLRTDRLPSSDVLNGFSWTEGAVGILQQNNNFTFYVVGQTPLISGSIPTLSVDPADNTPDIDDLPGTNNVIDTFSCAKMVDLDCYKGTGSTFRVDTGCTKSDGVENGCYLFCRVPMIDLFKDFGNFQEYMLRLKVMIGVCGDVISESFTNNWINGTLYQFPIKVDTFYNFKNQPFATYANELIYYDVDTSNFYYRSSPYNINRNEFIGVNHNKSSRNQLNLQFPTTIINLGVKDEFYQEIIVNPEAKIYTVPFLDNTSYGETSDIINFYVISRLLSYNTLARLVAAFNLNPMFIFFLFRGGKIDGDLAQSLSINSEIGVVKFSAEAYSTNVPNPPAQIIDVGNYNIMAIWFSSSTEDLQLRDFVTPGAISFTTQNGTAVGNYVVGVKSQRVPFYQWGIATSKTIFGNGANDWYTDGKGIFSDKYQSLDRTKLLNPGYFQSTTTPSNFLSDRRGYIYSVDTTGQISKVKPFTNKFLVGAPFHFYFGISVGATAMDKFKSKYLGDE